MLDTNSPNNYSYITNHLEIAVLGGIKLNHLNSLRVTLIINKTKHHDKLRHNIDLYNDNQVEKLVRKTAERIEIGTSIVRRQSLWPNLLANYQYTETQRTHRG